MMAIETLYIGHIVSKVVEQQFCRDYGAISVDIEAILDNK
jgi:hypothetical protein